MTQPEPSKRFGKSQPAQSAMRPKIWIEGRQRPRFDLKAYAATSFGMAKRDLAPEMLNAELRLRGLGQRVAKGELRTNWKWTGRLQRVLPSHHRVSGWILGLAEMFAESRIRLDPAEAEDAELAYPNLIRRVTDPAPIKPGKSDDEPTLHAIRSAISLVPHNAGPEVRQRGTGAWTIPAEPAAETDEKAGLVAVLKQWLRSVQCWVLLSVLITFALPSGAIKAMLFHLDGGDLGDWT